MDEIIASLTEEELDLLNSDPKLLAEFKAKYAAPKSIAEANLESLRGQGPLTELRSALDIAGKPARAGIAGLAELATGKGLQPSAETVEKIQEGGKAETGAGKFGEFVGEMVSPENILLQVGLEKAILASGIGKWIGDVVAGWGEQAALKAIGYVKSLGDAIGVNSIDEFGRFLLTPFQVAGKSFEPIVTAGKSQKQMLAHVKDAATQAGKVLESTGKTMDELVTANPNAINLEPIDDGIKALQNDILRHTEELEKPVVAQYEKFLNDFYTTISNGIKDNNLFSSLQELKTRIGKMVFHDEKLVPSKEALNKGLQVLSQGIDDVARSLDPAKGAAMAEASAMYHKLKIVESALEGTIKANAGKGINWLLTTAPAASATLVGSLLGGHLGGAIGATAGLIAPHIPSQAIASGLNTASKFAAPLIKSGVPLTANAVRTALQGD